jgi:hypothetical protein
VFHELPEVHHRGPVATVAMRHFSECILLCSPEIQVLRSLNWVWTRKTLQRNRQPRAIKDNSKNICAWNTFFFTGADARGITDKWALIDETNFYWKPFFWTPRRHHQFNSPTFNRVKTKWWLMNGQALLTWLGCPCREKSENNNTVYIKQHSIIRNVCVCVCVH